MPVPTIFLIDANQKIVEMKDQPYDSEEILQELLAQFPSVLAGDQLNCSAPIKWLLVSREIGIPDQEGGTDRWSLDHIFIDQAGIPTFVEVKRSSDTRIRREVVGQMLDYAANAVLYWPVETIRQRFEATCEEAESESEPEMVIAEFIGAAGLADADKKIAAFWEAVETNLRAGKIRLIFAADAIPAELKRVVEFLNKQMNPAEVLAVEIRQYVGTGVRTLVPSVIGTPKRTTTMEGRGPFRWNRESFLSALRERKGAETASIAEDIMSRALNCCPTVWWGNGRQDGSCFMGLSRNGIRYFPFSLWTSGWIQFPCQMLQQRGVAPELIKEFVSTLNEIAGTSMPLDAPKFPQFEMALLKKPGAVSQFLQAVATFVGKIDVTMQAATASV